MSPHVRLRSRRMKPMVGYATRAPYTSDLPPVFPPLYTSLLLPPLNLQVNACSTFNVLNAEDRRVAAALLQLSPDEESTISK